MTNDLRLKASFDYVDSFLDKAKILIDMDSKYDPNPGKTAPSIDWIKQEFPALEIN